MALFISLLCLFLPFTEALTVHLVPHTHDDVGWLKTVDEYFSGSNNTIQNAAVRNILNAVTTSLQKNPNRKFTYVEQAFFMRWWRELTPSEQDATRTLVKNGQLNFVNGGWCMHDEAATHYVDMVDQTTLGHRLLKEAFGEDGVVTIGWQLDPFGHSATQAALLSAETGFDGLFFGRIDYQDLALRHQTKRNEFIWRASPSLGDDSQIFSGLSGEYGGNYGPPAGFNWNGNDEPVETNHHLTTYNVPSRVEAAVQFALNQANMTRGENIMWTMGSDFNYEDAEVWFTNMDKLLESVNNDGRMKMQYSSPAEYVAAKRAETNVQWPITTDDFFPYADGPHQFWTGYFTSRPALKGYVRSSSALFTAARLLQSVVGGEEDPLMELNRLEEAMGVTQHHDAVSGTAKQHVAFDYARRLSAGVEQASIVISRAISTLNNDTRKSSGKSSGTSSGNSNDADGAASEYEMCSRLNETVCAATSNVAPGGDDVEIVMWNSLGHSRTSELVTIPVSTSDVTVKNKMSGKIVPSQTYAAGETVGNYARDTKETEWVVSFAVDLPPLGHATYTLEIGTPQELESKEVSAIDRSSTSTLENEYLLVNFSSNGLMESVTNKETGISVQMLQTFCYYISSRGDKKSGQRSGAYIFRPTSQSCYPIQQVDGGATVTAVQGDVVSEIRQVFSDWLTQTIRLPAGARHLELEHTVGAIPFRSTTANKTLEQCVSWRQTGNCDPNGPREPDKDQHCLTSILETSSGYCECYGGRKAQLSSCGHTSFTCEQACYFTEGREIVSRFNTSIASNGMLSTDSNGREMLLRKKNHRTMWNFSQTESIAGNYYPVNTAASLSDGATAEMTLLVDRASGVGSIADGEMEVMLHRRILDDDGRGVGEPLNETRDIYSYAGDFGGTHSGPGLVIRGTHRITLEEPKKAASIWRPLADQMYAPPLMLVRQTTASSVSSASSSTTSSTTPSSTSSSTSHLADDGLPANLQLMTLQSLSKTELLVRISHQYGIGEDAMLSLPATVDVAALLSKETFDVVSVREVSLTNSMNKSAVLEQRARNLEWNTEGAPPSPHEWRHAEMEETTVTLGPLEIKTFVVTVKN